MKKSEYILDRFLQRAADGGIAAKALEWNGLLMVEARRKAIAEWASEGEPKSVGEPELALRYKGPVCDSIRKEGAQASSRVAPQDLSPVPAK